MDGPSVRDLVQLLETTTLTVWAGPSDARIPLRDVVIHDATAGLEAGPGDLLLAIGTDPAPVLPEAAAAGVAAVVVRNNVSDRDSLTSIARQAGIGLLAFDPAIGWAQLTGRLRGALAAWGAGPDLPDHTLTGFANALADAVGGSVIVFTPQQEVLAASRLRSDDDPMRRQAVIDQHGPSQYRECLRQKGVYRRLWGGDDQIVEIDAEPDFGAGRRLAIAIRAGEENLGSIWVAEGSDGLAPDAAATLRTAVAPAARLLLRMGVQAQTQRFSEGVARQVLTGESDAGSAAGWLGVNPALPCLVVSCVPLGESPGVERRLADLLTMHVAAYRSTAIPVIWRGRVDLLCCGLDADDAGPVARVQDLVRRAVRALRHPVLAAVGAPSSTLASARESRAEADLVLRVLLHDARSADQTRIAALADVRATAELLVLSDLIAANPELRCGRIATLLAHDRDHHTCYAESLSAYLDAFGDVNRAASTLNIHPNTLRYRVRRVTEICGLDLDDPDERLMAAIQLRTSMLAEPANSPLPVGALA